MDTNRILDFIENSFLKDLLTVQTITDISFNGKDIFYQDNKLGRKKALIDVNSKEAYDFIRQIANLSDSQFSYTDPILDISIGKYRINATHYALARKEREKTITFSIRIGFNELRIKEDNSFIEEKCLNLLRYFLDKKMSIVIGGLTSSGKTELQKFLLSKLEQATRILIIDNVDELDIDFINKTLDIQTWININDDEKINFDKLVKNALRNNPDYLVIGESRGEEMLSILNSAMSGHPTITTIHSKDIKSMYSRMTRMCMLKNQSLKYDETLIDVYEHFKLLIHVKKKTNSDGTITRFIDSIATNRFNKIRVIYKYPSIYYKLPNSIKYDLDLNDKEFLSLKEIWENNNV